jgi:uncharacterized integral membrane protein
MPSEETMNSPELHSGSGKRTDEQTHTQGPVTKGLWQSLWLRHRIFLSVGAVVTFLLLIVVIQNPATTTVDLLLWTLVMRQGMSLALLFLAGWLCGWATGRFSRG